MPHDAIPPFSRPYLVDTLPEGVSHVRIEADPVECAALTEANAIVAVEHLEASFALTRRRSGDVHVSGAVHARVTQTCIVSLEAFDSDMNEPVDLVFMPAEGLAAWMLKHKARLADEPSLADEDPPDVIRDGRIDLGQVAAEFLALGLDPYPRKPGVAFEPPADEADKDPSPFAALARLNKGS